MSDFIPANTVFTGRRMLCVMLAFFGTIISVNLMMFNFAGSSFGGLVVGNSYIASQRFNDVRAAARAQPILGWRITATGGTPLVLSITGDDGPVGNLVLTALAYRPTKGHETTLLGFAEYGGRYHADTSLQNGLWALDLSTDDGQRRTIRVIIPEGEE